MKPTFILEQLKNFRELAENILAEPESNEEAPDYDSQF